MNKQHTKRNRRIVVADVTADDAKAIALALTMPDVKAFAIIVGTLHPLSHRGRQRVMTFIDAYVSDRDDVGNTPELSARNGGKP